MPTHYVDLEQHPLSVPRDSISDAPTADSVIRFRATVGKVTTLADGGLRVTLDLADGDIQQASDLMRCRQAGAVLECAMVAVYPASGDAW